MDLDLLQHKNKLKAIALTKTVSPNLLKNLTIFLGLKNCRTLKDVVVLN